MNEGALSAFLIRTKIRLTNIGLIGAGLLALCPAAALLLGSSIPAAAIRAEAYPYTYGGTLTGLWVGLLLATAATGAGLAMLLIGREMVHHIQRAEGAKTDAEHQTDYSPRGLAG